ncbi:MAG: hypothetical protein ACLTY5_08075 [Angelakisella sp.]
MLLLTVCIAAGAMGLPRLLGESFSIPEAAEPRCPVPRCGSAWTSCRLVISRVESLDGRSG